jgi:hypothetical protein
MNEKIRELAEQSQLWDRLDPRSLGIPGGSTESRWGEELQEFAELIVAECARLCEHESNDDEYDQYDMGQSVKAESIKTAIKQHFGVEE